ncbi:MAG: hypothetical protein V1717_03170, partial [Candidatus Micrarchaeota archaeon]
MPLEKHFFPLVGYTATRPRLWFKHPALRSLYYHLDGMRQHSPTQPTWRAHEQELVRMFLANDDAVKAKMKVELHGIFKRTRQKSGAENVVEVLGHMHQADRMQRETQVGVYHSPEKTALEVYRTYESLREEREKLVAVRGDESKEAEEVEKQERKFMKENEELIAAGRELHEFAPDGQLALGAYFEHQKLLSEPVRLGLEKQDKAGETKDLKKKKELEKDYKEKIAE